MTQPEEDYLVLDDDRDTVSEDLEAPPADALEQATPVSPAAASDRPRIGFEVNEADAVEQAQVVDLDEDDYR